MGLRVRTHPRITYGERIDDRERFVRGAGCRPDGGWVSADIRYRRVGMTGFLSVRPRDHEIENQESTPPAIGLGDLEMDLEVLRACFQTADLFPPILIDDFLEPGATERAVNVFSVLRSQRLNNFSTPTSGRSPTQNRRRSGASRSSSFRPSPDRRDSSVS